MSSPPGDPEATRARRPAANAYLAGTESAVFVRIRVPPGVERLRRRHDPQAAMGVPAHVTLLYPFLPPADLVPAVRARLGGLARSQPVFDVTFAAMGRFPAVAWLAPLPARTFIDLIGALSSAFPGYPPYGGQFDTVIPHLTIAEHDGPDVLAAVDAALLLRLPFTATATRVTVAVTGTDGRWRTRWRLPFGPGTTAR